ncbi:MAG: ABC transporter substrate-binding protein [Patescibacteria group bacterium]
MSKKKWWISGLLAVGVVAILAAYSPLAKNSQPQAQPVPQQEAIKIGYRAQDLYAPLFVGLEKKIFEAEGLKIEPIKFESTNQLMEAMLGKRIDASLGGVNTILLLTLEEKSPNQFKLFSMTTENQDQASSYLLVRADSNIDSIKKLENKKIASFLGSTAKMLYRKTVDPYFDPKNSTLIQMEPNLELQALQSGQVDAAIVLEPLATIGASKKISKTLEKALFAKYFFNDLPLSGSIVSVDFINRQPELTKKLVLAANKAIDFIKNNEEETKTIITKYTPLTPEVASQISIIPSQKLNEINMAKLQQLADLLLAEKELKNQAQVVDLLLAN